jgi:hypothetical protein
LIELYDALEVLTGERPMTNQIPRFMEECKPWLLRWFPALDTPEAQFEIGKLSCMLETPTGEEDPEHLIIGWLSGMKVAGHVQESYGVERIPKDDHRDLDAYDELVIMRGTDERIVRIDL